jgi:N-formylglutamate deformylase
VEIKGATITVGDGPRIATAIHDGHGVRPEVAELLALDDGERLREEDPFTGGWTSIAETRVVGLRSRFEIDLNRERSKAVYLSPEDAWGLRVWSAPPPPDLIERSLAVYDEFYAAMRELLEGKIERYGVFVVFDLHTYNHRRGGPQASPAPAEENPEINVGTRSIAHPKWRPAIRRFVEEIAASTVGGRPLDVRENVKFGGGHFAQWVNGEFGEHGFDLAIEVKKIFMDEWTGRPDPCALDEIGAALARAADGVLEELKVG